MRPTFFGLDTARKALMAQQRALDVTGHNIANANTEGYSRQRAIMQTTSPYAMPSENRPILAGQVGTGVEIQQITRLRDGFIDLQVRKENSTTGEWEARRNSLEKLEVIINEPSDSGIRTVLDQFWQALQTLSMRPEDKSVRAIVRQRGMAVAETFTHMHQQFVDLQADLDMAVKVKVGEMNNLADQIGSLNGQIVQIEVSGDHANDLRDKRDLLVDQMAKLAKVEVREDPFGALTVLLNGRAIVDDQRVEHLTTEVMPPYGFSEVRWERDDAPVNLQAGTIRGLVYSRDSIVADQRNNLNEMATRFITLFNGQHQLGHGLDSNTDVPSYVPGDVGVSASLNAWGAPSSLDFTNPQKLIVAVDGGAPQVIELSGNYADLTSLLTDVNSGLVGATAADDGTGKIIFTSDSMGTASSVVVTGPASPALGFGRMFFTGTDAGSIGLDANIDNLDRIAAAGGPLVGGIIAPGDNNNALRLAALKHNTNAMGTSTFDDFFRSTAAQLGVDGQAAKRMVDNQQLLISQLAQKRQEISGVSLDEEMTNMIKFQHAYNAAARVITIMDQMLDTIITRLGIVGR